MLVYTFIYFIKKVIFSSVTDFLSYPEYTKLKTPVLITKKEGISSMLSVPVIVGERIIGCMRVYTSEPWEFILEDVNFVQAVALIVGMSLEMCRISQGYRDSIEILKSMRDPRIFRPKKRKGYVPGSFPNNPPLGM